MFKSETDVEERPFKLVKSRTNAGLTVEERPFSAAFVEKKGRGF